MKKKQGSQSRKRGPSRKALKSKQLDARGASHTRLTWVGVSCLWLLCLCSALSVVYSSFDVRRSTQALDSLRREAVRLRVVSGQYQLEKSSWAAYSRIEKIARDNLEMKVPEQENTVLVFRK